MHTSFTNLRLQQVEALDSHLDTKRIMFYVELVLFVLFLCTLQITVRVFGGPTLLEGEHKKLSLVTSKLEKSMLAAISPQNLFKFLTQMMQAHNP